MVPQYHTYPRITVPIPSSPEYWQHDDLAYLNHCCFLSAVQFPDCVTSTFIEHYFQTLQEPDYNFKAAHLEYLAGQIEICT
jgi:hypothetical protein